MKQFIALTTIFLMFASATMAQSDYNYSFYPSSKYRMLQTTQNRDTVKNEYHPKTDTTDVNIFVFVEKQNGRFTVRKISNISETVYDMNVKFVGVDQSGNMVYKAQTDAGETIFVNPLAASVEIVFQRCVDDPQPGGGNLVRKRCDEIRHIFGNIAPKAKTPTEPVKPK